MYNELHSGAVETVGRNSCEGFLKALYQERGGGGLGEGVGKWGHRPVWLLRTVIGRVLHRLRCGWIVSENVSESTKAEPNSALCLPRDCA